MLGLKGKAALVTGSAVGIGQSAALTLAKEGAKVMLADFNEAGAKETAAMIEKDGGVASAIFLDANDEESIRAAVKATVDQFGTIDILVNNVGVTIASKDLDVLNVDLDYWDQTMKTNLKSVLIGSREAIPYMQKNGGGSIVNTASGSGMLGDIGRTAYGTSKAGVINLTRYIATQYGSANIRCNTVSPGLILTPTAKRDMTPEVLKILGKFNALPYQGEPEDIGNAIAFLASDASKFITGQNIVVDGGLTTKNPSVDDMIELMSKQG